MDPDTRATTIDLAAVPPVDCPCGASHRMISDPQSLSFHVVDIKADAKTHYHNRLTEYYFVLEGEGEMELDGERRPVRPGTLVVIPPGVRHRAIGAIRILNVVHPGFDKADEHFDD